MTNFAGTQLTTEEHYHKIFSFLSRYSNQWWDIGLALGFSRDELANIQSNPLLLLRGSSGYLGDMLGKWLQWAPGDGRRSEGFATFEDLHAALLNVNDTAASAYNLGPALSNAKLHI